MPLVGRGLERAWIKDLFIMQRIGENLEKKPLVCMNDRSSNFIMS